MIDNELKYAFKDIAKLEFLEGIERELLEAAEHIKPVAIKLGADDPDPKDPTSRFNKKWVQEYNHPDLKPESKKLKQDILRVHIDHHNKNLSYWEDKKEKLENSDSNNDSLYNIAKKKIKHHSRQKNHLENILHGKAKTDVTNEPSIKQEKANNRKEREREKKLELDTNSVSFQSVVRGKIPIMEMKLSRDEQKKAGIKSIKVKKPTVDDHLSNLSQALKDKDAAYKELLKNPENEKALKDFDLHSSNVLVHHKKAIEATLYGQHRSAFDAANAERDRVHFSAESVQASIHGFLGDQYMELAEHFEQKGNSYDANYCYDKAIYFFENGGVSLKK